MSIPEYLEDTELPSITRDWYDTQDNLINLSGATFVVRVGIPGRTAVVTKTTGITGAATSPNLTIDWAAGELDALTPGRWNVHVLATTAGEQRTLRFALRIRPVIAAA